MYNLDDTNEANSEEEEFHCPHLRSNQQLEIGLDPTTNANGISSRVHCKLCVNHKNSNNFIISQRSLRKFPRACRNDLTDSINSASRRKQQEGQKPYPIRSKRNPNSIHDGRSPDQANGHRSRGRDSKARRIYYIEVVYDTHLADDEHNDGENEYAHRSRKLKLNKRSRRSRMLVEQNRQEIDDDDDDHDDEQDEDEFQESHPSRNAKKQPSEFNPNSSKDHRQRHNTRRNGSINGTGKLDSSQHNTGDEDIGIITRRGSGGGINAIYPSKIQ